MNKSSPARVEAVERRRLLSAALPHVTQTAELDASAFFESERVVNGAVIVTDVNVAATTDYNATPKGWAPALTQATVSLQVTDLTNSVVLLLATSDPSQPQSATLSIGPGGKTIHLVADIGMVDEVSFSTFPAHADITWQPSGIATITTASSIDRSTPGVTLVTVEANGTRNATATGTLSSPGSTAWPLTGNQIPIPSLTALLAADVNTQISFPNPLPQSASFLFSDQAIGATATFTDVMGPGDWNSGQQLPPGLLL
ncbi:MAG TPA: hypothetical protein VGI81_25665 [Tepidisphaeraceae bacterium]